MVFELAGQLTLELRDDRERARRAVTALMDPYEPLSVAEGEADVVLEAQEKPHPRATLVDIHNSAGDGVVTATDGTTIFVVRSGAACGFPAVWDGGVTRLAYDPDFPIWSAFRSLVRPAMQLALLERGAAAVHSASVAVDGHGIVVAGWSETGKTETALALLERGARFVSDKWTILDSRGAIDPFPISVGVRRWALHFLPRLRDALPRRAAAQLAVAGVVGRVAAPIKRLEARGGAAAHAAGAVARAVALADRAALSPTEVAVAYGQAAPVRGTRCSVVAMLTTTTKADVTVDEASVQWAARRLARSAAFERRPFFELCRRARYAFPDLDQDAEREYERREEAFLRETLSGRTLLDVRAPFPTDPRRVAEAIASRL